MNKAVIAVLMLLLSAWGTHAQQTPEDDPKVQIFTYEEKANLQNWFVEEIKRMELTQEQESQYNSVLFYYIARISRLDDRDMGLTRAEFRARLNEYLAKQEADMKDILSPEQFAIHQEIYGEFLRSAYRRWGIED